MLWHFEKDLTDNWVPALTISSEKDLTDNWVPALTILHSLASEVGVCLSAQLCSGAYHPLPPILSRLPPGWGREAIGPNLTTPDTFPT
jgi:hypothetical protein